MRLYLYQPIRRGHVDHFRINPYRTGLSSDACRPLICWVRDVKYTDSLTLEQMQGSRSLHHPPQHRQPSLDG
jgi:hypothetical protein